VKAVSDSPAEGPKEVVIDGVRYVPEETAQAPWFTKPDETPKIGIAITTHNRPEILADTLKAFEDKIPSSAVCVVVDDGSKVEPQVPEPWELDRFEHVRGVPAAKNRCIELLFEAGCEHFFLFDDDTYPTAADWWVPYVVSPEPHLQYQFESAPDHWGLREIRRDNHHRVFDMSRGCMLYFTKDVVLEIGGFHNAWGRRGGFHECFSRRANLAGLTKFVYADVISPALHCRDEDEKGITSASYFLLWKHVDQDRLPLYAEFRSQPIPVLVPRRGDNGRRDQLWRYLKKHFWAPMADKYQVIEGPQPFGPFNRSQAINNAARIAGNWDVAVVADGDSWVPPAQLDEAVRRARRNNKVVSAFTELWELSEDASNRIIARQAPPQTPVKPEKRQMNHRSICLVIPRVVFEAVGGFDEAYRGWGAEDDAFWHAVKLVAGEPERVTGKAYHLYHPPASTKAERAEDPIYIRNWNRWQRFKKCTSIEEVRRFIKS